MSWGRAQVVQSCCVCISPDELAVYEYCQSYQGVVSPGTFYVGLNCCGLCVTMRTISNRIKEIPIKCETKTKDNVFVTVEAAVQQCPITSRAKDAIYSLRNPNQQIESYVIDVIRAEVPTMTLEEVFTNKDTIAQAVSAKLKTAMEKFGFNIKQVLVTNVEPDQKVKNALNAVEAAVKDRQALQSRAEAHKFVLIKKAEAESQSKALQGQGIARQRAAIVQGLRESLMHGPTKDQSNELAELLLVTQYFDTLEKIAEGQGTTVFIPAGRRRNNKGDNKTKKVAKESVQYGFG